MEYVKDILAILGILLLMFVIIPRVFIVIINFIKVMLKDNDRFD